MYIKQIIIEGFKSYYTRIAVEPFDRRHNVVVGRNGAGKSNFFAAIQFVLSDEFTHLRMEQRESLLHEGSGRRVVNAFVEIIFDNEDARIPIDTPEVHLRRTIGSKKDVYCLNKKIVTRAEVTNLLESAGFSKSNPFYIVKQGEINQMAIATDTQRLQLLREIAGTRVFDEKYEESRIILEATRDRVEKSAECLKAIVERVEILSEEKEELKEYERWDKYRRCLELAVYQREVHENKAKLKDLRETFVTSRLEQEELEHEVNSIQHMINVATERWEIANNEYETAQKEQHEQSMELLKIIQEATKLSLMINDLQEETTTNESEKKSAEHELEELEQRIDNIMRKIEVIRPGYEKVMKEETELKHELMLKDQQRKELYAKQGRCAQFTSREDRDAFIQQELDQLIQLIEKKQNYHTEITESLAEDFENHKNLEIEIEAQVKELEEQKRSIDKNEKLQSNLKVEEERIQSTLNKLRREENALQGKLSSEQENLLKAEHNLRLITGKAIINGRESVRKVLEIFKENPETSGLADGYCNLLIDNFTCDQSCQTAVEVMAGKRLFHHIVENDKLGTKILKEINKRNLPGEITFMPLNRLKVNTPNVQVSIDAIPMISKLVYDPKYNTAIRFIFGRILICRNLETATTMARDSGLDCVTLDGDSVSSKGFLTGGYHNREKSQIANYNNRTEILTKIGDLESQLTGIKAEIDENTKALTNCICQIQRAESVNLKAKDNCARMVAKLNTKKAQLNAIEDSRAPKQRSLDKCLSSLEVLNASKEGLERELNEDLMSQLSPNEREHLAALNEQIRTLMKQRNLVFDKRSEIENEKTQLESKLKNNLTRRRDELKQKLEKIAGLDRLRQLELYRNKLASVEETGRKISSEIQILNERANNALQTVKPEAIELEKLKVTKKDIQEKIEASAKILDKFTSKQNIYERKITEVGHKIAALGLMASTNTPKKIDGMTNKTLFKELEMTNNELKRYSHVNKKALEQFVIFSDEKAKLGKRQEELERSFEKIRELMGTLEQQKRDVIEFTFKQMSKYFTEVFQRLAPAGIANLVMKKSSTSDGSSGESSQISESGASDSDSFVGVAIRVSFTGRDVEASEMNQLSGGQKSLVALALIFAIQKCDPAPFYLFDEIDQTLDSQHREAVALMIHELSSEAQFITTTFRSEMLKRANKFYGVKYGNSVSFIEPVTQEEAANFVEDDDNHGQ